MCLTEHYFWGSSGSGWEVWYNISYQQVKNVGAIFRTYYVEDADNMPIQVGVEFDPNSLVTFIDDPDMQASDLGAQIVLDFPPEAMAVTPYKFMNILWQGHGHMPNPVYSAPHVDFHFIMIPEANLKSVKVGTCSVGVSVDSYCLSTQKLPIDAVPNGYYNPGAVFPQSGAHLAAFSAPEWNGILPFTQAFIYGIFNGSIHFHEPMISVSYLLTITKKQCYTFNGYPNAYATAGLYATKFCITPTTTKNLRVSLENFDYYPAAVGPVVGLPLLPKPAGVTADPPECQCPENDANTLELLRSLPPDAAQELMKSLLTVNSTCPSSSSTVTPTLIYLLTLALLILIISQ